MCVSASQNQRYPARGMVSPVCFFFIPDIVCGLFRKGNVRDKERRLCLRLCTRADDASLFIAFILYRQHHQHAIVARNPGIANPEISKVIGEQWKTEGEEIKKIWQALAEVCYSLQWLPSIDDAYTY